MNPYLRCMAPGLLMLFIVLDASAQDQYTLRITLNEGDTYTMQVSSTQAINQVIMGTPMDMTQTLGMWIRNDVTGVSDEGYEIKVTYERVSIKQEGPMGLQEYDSETTSSTDEIQPMFIGFSALADMNFIMRMDRRGQVYDIEGTEAILDSMIAKFDAQGLPTVELGDMLKQQFNDDSMQQEMERLLTVYPEEPVKIGDSWTQSSAGQTSMFPIRMANTYYVASEENGELNIEVDSIIESTEPDSASPLSMNMSMDIKGTQMGMLRVNLESGLPARLNLTQSMAGEISMDNPALGDSTMTWPIELNSDNIITVNR